MHSRFLSRLAVLLHLKPRVTFLSGWQLYICVAFILCAETTALTLLRQYSISGYIPFLLGGFLGYVLVSTMLIQSYRYEGMGVVNVLWSAFSVLFVILAGVLFFDEQVTVPQLWGTGMVIFGVVILRLPIRKSVIRGGQCLHISASDIPAVS